MTRSGQAKVVVKLGGSVVTDKKVPFSFNNTAVKELGAEIASSGIQSVIVHGGGSFGHTVAKKYGLSSRKSSPSAEGVSETRAAMFDLNSRICSELSASGLHPYSFSPFSLLDGSGGGAAFIDRLLWSGATPVTFGDVIHDGHGFRILSGDTICVELSEMIGASRCVMALDVDGILDEKGEVIKVLEDGFEAALPPATVDATGGIAFKISESMRMAASGTEVRLVSGRRPGEFLKALKGGPFQGTTVKVPRGVSTG